MDASSLSPSSIRPSIKAVSVLGFGRKDQRTNSYCFDGGGGKKNRCPVIYLAEKAQKVIAALQPIPTVSLWSRTGREKSDGRRDPSSFPSPFQPARFQP